MKLRFTALSINSMDMNTVMMFLRNRNPATPNEKRTASTMAPMMAIRIRIEVTSNGSRYDVNRARPTSCGPPPVKLPNTTGADFGNMPCTLKLRTPMNTANRGMPNHLTMGDFEDLC